MIITDGLMALLYIEPLEPPSREPLIDGYTKRMAAALDAHTETGMLQSGIFHAGIADRGVHTCSCGATSSHVDYLLPGGYVTNSLAVHYLAFHRNGVPAKQLERVLAMPVTDISPTIEQLNEPSKTAGPCIRP